MTVKTLIHPVTGRRFKLGRNYDPSKRPRLMFSHYVRRLQLPNPPTSTNYYGSMDAVGKSFMSNVLGNDVSGCCTCAAAYHLNGGMLDLAGRPILFTAQNCIDIYKQLSGWNGIEDDPSDTGLDEHAVLRYWQASGIPDASGAVHKITGDMGVSAANAKVACWLFDLYIAMSLPDAWVDPMPDADGFTWDVAGNGNPENGHAFMSFDFDATGLKIDTWGLLGTMTWAAVNKYITTKQGGALYAILTSDSINAASLLSPSGFNFAQLKADLQPGALGGVPA